MAVKFRVSSKLHLRTPSANPASVLHQHTLGVLRLETGSILIQLARKRSDVSAAGDDEGGRRESSSPRQSPPPSVCRTRDVTPLFFSHHHVFRLPSYSANVDLCPAYSTVERFRCLFDASGV
jgi:hypothetical protein